MNNRTLPERYGDLMALTNVFAIVKPKAKNSAPLQASFDAAFAKAEVPDTLDWQSLTDEELAELDTFLRGEPQLKSVLMTAEFHPTFPEIKALRKSGQLKACVTHTITEGNFGDTTTNFFSLIDRDSITQENYLKLVTLDVKSIRQLFDLLANKEIAKAVKDGVLNIHPDLIGQSPQILARFGNEKLQQLIDQRKMTGKECATLTDEQIAKITQEHIHKALSAGMITLASALSLKDGITSDELNAFITNNLTLAFQKKTVIALEFPNSEYSQEQIEFFDLAFITTYLKHGNRNTKHSAIELPNNQKCTLQTLNPALLELIFLHNKLNINQALSLPEQQKKYIIEIYNNTKFRDYVITNFESIIRNNLKNIQSSIEGRYLLLFSTHPTVFSVVESNDAIFRKPSPFDTTRKIENTLGWQGLLPQELLELEALVKADETIKKILINARRHPAFIEVLTLKQMKKLDTLKNNYQTQITLNNNSQTTFGDFVANNICSNIASNDVSRNVFMELIQYSPDQVQAFASRLPVVQDLITANIYSPTEVVRLEDTVFKKLHNRRICALLDAKKITTDDVARLSDSQLGQITQLDVYDRLLAGNVSLNFALRMNPNMSSSELANYLIKKQLIRGIFKDFSDDDIEKIETFEVSFISNNLNPVKENKQKLVEIVALSDDEKAKLTGLSKAVLDMTFKHNQLTVSQALSLTQTQTQYIIQAYESSITHDALIAGKLMKNYLPHAKSESTPHNHIRKLDYRAPLDKLLLDRLQDYINYVDKFPKVEGKINFGHGFFWIMRESRAANREGNYNLAKKLHADLKAAIDNKDPNAIAKVFTDEAIASRTVTAGFTDRGINSSRLKKVIHDAREHIAKQNTRPRIK